MSSIRNINMLYCSSLSMWAARKKDKAASRQCTQSHGAREGAANVNKQLLPGCVELDTLQKWSGNFRNWVYDRTLPWFDNGWRIGSAAAHMEFMAEAGDRIRDGMALVDDFVQAYPQAKAQAQLTLGDMFDASDYPTQQQLRAKFSFTIEVQAMSSAEDLRVIEGVPPEEVERLVKVAQAAQEKRIAEAMHEAYHRLYEVVGKLAVSLEQYGAVDNGRFYSAWMDNLTGQLEVMPALNLSGDPALTALAQQAMALTHYDQGALRDNERVRVAAIMEARQLMDQFPASITGVITVPQVVPVVPGLTNPVPEVSPTLTPDARALFADML